MKIPSDTWELEVEDLAQIYAKVDRMFLDDGSGAVDVVDFFMYPDGRSRGRLNQAYFLSAARRYTPIVTG